MLAETRVVNENTGGKLWLPWGEILMKELGTCISLLRLL